MTDAERLHKHGPSTDPYDVEQRELRAADEQPLAVRYCTPETCTDPRCPNYRLPETTKPGECDHERADLCEAYGFHLQAVQFVTADGERAFDGFGFGSYWNGFDVIKVTPEVRDQLVVWFADGQSMCCAHPRSSHAPDPADAHSMLIGGEPVSIDGDPRCSRCDCLSYEDGAAGLTEVKADPEGLYDLLGYVTSIERDEVKA